MDKKENLVIVRLPLSWSVLIANNEAVQERFNVHVVRPEPVEECEEYSNIKTAYQLTNDMVNFKLYLVENDISLAIISQKLFPLSMAAAKACNELGIRIIWTEAFFDNKLLFDTIGLPYCPENEIVKYKDAITYPEDFIDLIDYPQSTRQPQGETISISEFVEKYKLKIGQKYIVLLMQTSFDMSLKYSMNPSISDYRSFIDRVIRENPDVTFIYKLHPQYYGVHAYRRKDDMGFMNEYENAIEVRENINTLFKIFIHFVSFSSTTIFEGLINRYLKFATGGYHFMNDPAVVLLLGSDGSYSGLYKKLESFQSSWYHAAQYAYFICNHYAIDVSSPRLVDKLTMYPWEYYWVKEN